MTDQELFDKVVVHLRTQGARAVDARGKCMYRTEDGKKCAAGCLILEEHYDPSIEGKGVENPCVSERLYASGVVDSQIILVASLQRIHDISPVDQWRSELARVARLYNLTPPAAP